MPRQIDAACHAQPGADGTWTMTITVSGMTREEAEQLSRAAYEPVQKAILEMVGGGDIVGDLSPNPGGPAGRQ